MATQLPRRPTESTDVVIDGNLDAEAKHKRISIIFGLALKQHFRRCTYRDRTL